MPQLAQDIVFSQEIQGDQDPTQSRDIEFGRICKQVCDLATGIFDIPLAFIKIYDGSQLVTRASTGIPNERLIEDLSFCQRKLIPGESLVIPDATADARYFLEAAVLDAPKLRFYVDIPLVCDGVVLGLLGLCERTPRHDFTPSKLNLLRQFANSSATTIALSLNASGSNLAFELKSQQARFDLAQDMTGIGCWTLDLKTRDVTWSKGLYAVYGLSPKAYKPRVATQLDIYETADQPLIIDKFQRAVNAGEDFDFNVDIIRRKDKITRTIRTKGGVELGNDGKPARLYAVVRDVSEAVSGDEELIKARMAAEDITEAKTDFLTHITEELKTPLNNILAYARLLNEQRFENPDVASYTLNLLKSAKSLQSLVKDTLDVTNLEAQAPRDIDHAHSREDAVNVANLVKDVVNQFAPQAQASQTRLTAQFIEFDNPYAQIDSMRLRQVLQNLIGNACKFTRGGLINVTASQVTVDSAIGKGPQKLLRISIHDTGIGMSDDQSLGLFAGDLSDARKSGQGLGLSISKAIIDLLGGHIGVVSRIGEGSNFWFEIPVQWATAPAKVIERTPYAAMIPVPAPRPLRAPVDNVRSPVAATPLRGAPVDDERINREYLRALLEDMKLDIH